MMWFLVLTKRHNMDNAHTIIYREIFSIAIRLKLARRKRNFRSARKFAKRYTISESTYAQHESGKRSLSIITLLKYSGLLSINPAWLLTGEGDIDATSNTNNTAVSENL